MIAAPLRIRLNGQPREVASGTSVGELVRSLGRDVRTVAVERNGAILPRGDYEAVLLQEDDRLEIVHFVQGG